MGWRQLPHFSTPHLVLHRGSIKIWGNSISCQARLFSLALKGPEIYLVPACSLETVKCYKASAKQEPAVTVICGMLCVQKGRERIRGFSSHTCTFIWHRDLQGWNKWKSYPAFMNEACDKVVFLLFGLSLTCTFCTEKCQLKHWLSAKALGFAWKENVKPCSEVLL